MEPVIGYLIGAKFQRLSAGPLFLWRSIISNEATVNQVRRRSQTEEIAWKILVLGHCPSSTKSGSHL